MNSIKIFLSSIEHVQSQIVPFYNSPPYALESFYRLKSNTPNVKRLIEWFKNSAEFMLDSGAYTFMCKPQNKINFDDYVSSYIDFVNEHDIQYFFEMDVDNILGYEKVLELRAKIEDGTGKKVVPVWHKSRGKDEFVKMCEQYDFVAIGGIASREIKPSEFDLVRDLCDIAHSMNCKVHGLGYLRLDSLNNNTCPFDTVDGSSWQGHMRGKSYNMQYVNGHPVIVSIKDEPKRDWKIVIKECYEIWSEYSKAKGITI